MKFLLKIVLFMLLCNLITGCGSAKNKRTTTATTQTAITTDTEIKNVTDTVIERSGDTLQGVAPLPKLSTKPVIIKVESEGTALDLEITDTAVKYKSIPKHTGTVKIKSATVTTIKKNEKTDVAIKDKNETVKQRWRPPWQLLLALVALVLIALKLLYNKLRIIF